MGRKQTKFLITKARKKYKVRVYTYEDNFLYVSPMRIEGYFAYASDGYYSGGYRFCAIKKRLSIISTDYGFIPLEPNPKQKDLWSFEGAWWHNEVFGFMHEHLECHYEPEELKYLESLFLFKGNVDEDIQ